MKRKIRDIAVNLYLSAKRLIKKPAFALLLLAVPLTALALRFSLSKDSGIMKIGIINEGSNTGTEITEKLLASNGIISFKEYSDAKKAENDVISEKLGALWIFPENLDQVITANAETSSLTPLVRVIEKNETVTNKLSHELLFGSIYPYIVYENYLHFTESKYGEKADTSEEALRHHYDSGAFAGEVIRFITAGKEKTTAETTGVVTLPVRGILSVLVMLCGLAAMIYFLTDREDGKYVRMSPKKHIIPAYTLIFCAVIMASAAVLFSVYLLGIYIGAVYEIAALLLYSLNVCTFCLIWGLICGKPGRLCCTVPLAVIGALTQSPVFFTSKNLRPLGFLFPQSSYLFAIYDRRYFADMIVYTAVSFVLLLSVNILLPDKNQ